MVARSGLLVAVLFVLASAPAAGVRAADDPLPPSPPDYRDAADWACRPGQEAACTSGLDAMLIRPDGAGTLQRFQAAPDPPIDCFYVYPTASRARQGYADIDPAPAILAVIRQQAGRLAARCRLYAPLYRQATLYHLHHLRHAGGPVWDGPYQDISAAWDDYMANDNHGRGVVLVGHSQGTILLQRLIAEKLDGRPAQQRLVSAFLIGDPGLLVPRGRTLGGTFKHIPLCTAAPQIGCAYAWASYFEGDAATRAFGVGKDGLVAACTNPANPGGAGTLDSFFTPSDVAAAGAQPFAEVVGQIMATCADDAQGAVLRIKVLPGRSSEILQSALQNAAISGHAKDWGLHRQDVALAQGSILRLLDAEVAAWRSRPQ